MKTLSNSREKKIPDGEDLFERLIDELVAERHGNISENRRTCTSLSRDYREEEEDSFGQDNLIPGGILE